MDKHLKDIIYTIHRMKHLCDALEKENEFVGYRHIASSCALLRYPETKSDAVRIGSAFLGRLPFPDQWGYEPVGELEAVIEDIRTLPAGTGIGYDHAFITSKPTTIAIVSAGYIHRLGIRRNYNCPGFFYLPRYLYHLLKNTLFLKNLYAYYGKESFPVLGRIGMNSSIIDITEANLSVGDIVRFSVNPLYVSSSIPRAY